jgi:hypothetical protein
MMGRPVRILNRSKSSLFTWDGDYLKDYPTGKKLYRFKSGGTVLDWRTMSKVFLFRGGELLEYPTKRIVLRYKDGYVSTDKFKKVLRRVGIDRWVAFPSNKVLFYCQDIIPAEVIELIWILKLKEKEWR